MAKNKEKPKKVKKKRSLIMRIIRFFFWTGLFLAILAACAAFGAYLHFSRDLPQINSIMDYRPPVVTTIYSDDGRKIAEFFRERRYVIPIEDMPKTLTQAFVAAEDSRFYQHEGVDFLGILRAAKKNLEAGGLVQGGSTITQQVTKSFLLTPEKSFSRKIREAILAQRIDRKFTKEQILYLYLNQIYLGNGCYGVEAAARGYFGKHAKDLTLAECALLAGLPKAPGRDDPVRHPKRAKQRQTYVLNRMLEEGYITKAQAAQAQDEPLDIKSQRNLFMEQVPYYTEHVRRYIEEKYGRDMLLNGGLTIYTAVNVEMQKEAQAAIRHGLLDLDKRLGFRGPIDHLAPEKIETFCQAMAGQTGGAPLQEGMVLKGVVTEVDDAEKKALVRMGDERGEIPIKNMRWARQPDPEVAYYTAKISLPSQALSPGDVVQVVLKKRPEEKNGPWELELTQDPEAQAALMCLETGTGLVKAMVGGYDFANSQFNRAIQAMRQPGSAFKPVIYAAALDHPEKPYTAASVLIDSPIVFKDESMDFTWKPKNYKKTFHGPTLLRDALAHSRNVVTIKILQDIGVGYVIDYARTLGITAPLARDLSIALGSSGMSLLEVVTAYSVFANQGVLVEPAFVTKITDRDGRVLEEHKAQGKKAIERSTAYVMTHLLQGVVEHGTGWRVRALKRPVAGKTGTTNNLNDAWFVGYTPRYVTGVWVGFDSEEVLGKGETGSRAASPIWLAFMQDILRDKPVKVFPVPEGVVFAKIDAKTGLLATPKSQETVFEAFKEGTAPTGFSPDPEEPQDPGKLMKEDISRDQLMKMDI